MNVSGEFDVPLTYHAPKLMESRQYVIQGLAVEALGVIDEMYGLLLSAVWFKTTQRMADAFSYLTQLMAEAQDLASEIGTDHPSLAAIRKGASKGGLRSGATRRLNSPLPDRQTLRSERDRLIREGRSSRDVAAIFSQRYNRTADYIRKLLRQE
jgi:hypothetical protein